MVQGDRVGALLVNTGSPSAPEPAAVKSYLAEFLMDPCVRPCPAIPWWLILHLCILPVRKKRSAAKYRLIWRDDGSPLVATARALAAQVEGLLEGGFAPHTASFPPVVRAAMSYGEPGLTSSLAELRDAGVTSLTVIPLYPQSAKSTTDSVLTRVRASLDALGWEPVVHIVESYGAEEAYLDAVAAGIRAAGLDSTRDRLMFSFHAVPHPDVEAGDTYPDQVARTCAALADRLGVPSARWSVSYQSPFADGRLWHGPFTTDLLEDVAARTEGNLVFVCPGFSIDCLETLYDVERGFAERARAAFPADGAPHEFVYVPCLNDTPAAARLMADLVRRTLPAR